MSRRPRDDTEAVLVRALERTLGDGRRGRVRVGIGDDAAVLDARGLDTLVWTVDAAVQGVHFDRRWLGLADVGRRAAHAAVSDVAAMGAKPIAMLSALVLPAEGGGAVARAVARGQARAAEELGCPVVGGNVSRGAQLEVTTTVIGHAARPIRRVGARPGDEVWLLGFVGASRAGLLSLQRSGRLGGSGAVAACQRVWRAPRALVAEGRSLQGRAHACIDLSDGLAIDAGRLAEQSRVRIVIDAEALGRAFHPKLRAACRALSVEPLSVAVEGGEDYALLATGPANRRPRGAVAVGHVERGAGAWLEGPSGLTPLMGGYDHLRR